ncbi:hypothetical protein MTR67_012495 [Solanum verrucosum]|uniref:Integrase zinc-binding domain-containing protein n=1 Tax=Solanum verrucosum TaxID=315347 RepID=A0AAF0QD51_SOLVR|nr:hypothetical protein MTR67_012495 [Solanum verrucosum]
MVYFVNRVAYVFLMWVKLRQQILTEAHNSRYSIHPGATKMYCDLREVFWWNCMKRDIADFVAKCCNCQQVKVEHQKLVDRGPQKNTAFLDLVQEPRKPPTVRDLSHDLHRVSLGSLMILGLVLCQGDSLGA